MAMRLAAHVEQVAERGLNDLWGLIAIGLGISFHPSVFIGGLFMALAGASVARWFNPEEDRREYWLVILTAVFLAILVAIGMAHQPWLPDFPPQLAMAAAGFFSRPLARIFIRLGQRLEDRTDDVADKIIDKVLPEDKE